jgi:hypothetical protein
MEESKVPRSPETFGQNMLENQLEKLRAWKRSCEHLFAFAVLVTKGHLAILTGDNIFFLDDPFIEIATEIDQRFLAVAGEFAIDNPGFGIT